MSNYTQILYQVVFATKDRKPCLTKGRREDLFKYIAGIISNKQCFAFEIGGVNDHLHILLRLHPSVSLASLIKDIKMATSLYIKAQNLFPDFRGWQDGYGAFTYSFESKDKLVNYVKNQEEHHKHVSFREEYIEFLKENNIAFEDKYLL